MVVPQDDIGVYCGRGIHVPMPEGLRGCGVLFAKDVHVGMDRVYDPFEGIVLADDICQDPVVLVSNELQDEALGGSVGLEGVPDEGFDGLGVRTLFPGQATDAGDIVQVEQGEW